MKAISVGDRVFKDGRSGTVTQIGGDAAEYGYERNQYGDCAVQWDGGEDEYEWQADLKPAE